jgi:hypothetical protein
MSIDPLSKKVVVSLRRDYHALLGKKNMGETGQEVDALYWDYDDEFIENIAENPAPCGRWMNAIHLKNLVFQSRGNGFVPDVGKYACLLCVLAIFQRS